MSSICSSCDRHAAGARLNRPHEGLRKLVSDRVRDGGIDRSSRQIDGNRAVNDQPVFDL